MPTKIKIPENAKLFRSELYFLMYKGVSFEIMVDDFLDGTFAAHGQQSTDESMMVPSVSGTSLEECLQKIVDLLIARV